MGEDQSMSTLVQSLRTQLADTLVEMGPDAPTLCEGWTARDLAAHLVVRERRPDALPGILIPAFAGRTDRIMHDLMTQDYGSVVDLVRGKPVWSPYRLGVIDGAVNTVEFAVHLEDLRRGDPSYAPVPPSPELDAAVWSRLALLRRVMLRAAPTRVRLSTADGRSSGPADAPLVVTGNPLELLMFCFGRQAAADVTVDGPSDQVAALKAATLGV
jgi:uncharacterized protein (TIGR03085 family)